MRRPSAGTIATIVLLTVATLAVYLRTFSYGFVEIDDGLYVSQNGIVKQGLSVAGLRWALTTFHASNWHPLTWLSLMLDCDLFGVNPGGHHAVNALLHLASSLLLFLALLKMTGHRWRCGLVAAVFALHPAHVESVAWISERKDVLCAFFVMLALWLYAFYAERPDWKRYLSVLAAFTLALLSKPMAVTFPLVLLLLDYWPLRRIEWPPKPAAARSLVLEKLPLLALSAVTSVLTFLAQKADFSVVTLAVVPFPARCANAAIAYVRYLEKTVWPVHLAMFYPLLKPGRMATGVSLAILAAVTCATATVAKRHPYLLVGWLWFLGTLVPVIGLVQVGLQSMADRYLYVPMVGLSIAAIWAVAEAVQTHPAVRRAALGLALTSLAALACAAYVQAGYWRKSSTVFRQTLAVTSGNFEIENSLVLALSREGDTGAAMEVCQGLLASKPDWPPALANMGSILATTGRVDEARLMVSKAVRLAPEDERSLVLLAAILAATGDFEGAREHLEVAVRVRPRNPRSHNELCYALQRLGRLDEAISQCKTALALDPGFLEARFNLGTALAAQSRKDEAAAEFSRVLDADPNYAAAETALRQLR